MTATIHDSDHFWVGSAQPHSVFFSREDCCVG